MSNSFNRNYRDQSLKKFFIVVSGKFISFYFFVASNSAKNVAWANKLAEDYKYLLNLTKKHFIFSKVVIFLSFASKE